MEVSSSVSGRWGSEIIGFAGGILLAGGSAGHNPDGPFSQGATMEITGGGRITPVLLAQSPPVVS